MGGIKGERRKKLNKMLSGWNYGKLRDYINYKAEEKGLVTTEVNPKNTSKEMP